MARQKGDGKGNQGGGRKPGTPNKVTQEIREVLTPVIANYVGGIGIGENKRKLEDDLDAMDPEARARIITNLVPYVVPKLATVEVNKGSDVKTFKDELEELENS